MHQDVVDLRSFYYRTTLGRAARTAIRAKLHDLWPEAKGLTVAGFGFAVPLLSLYTDEARRVIALMPGQQGVMHWPIGQENVCVLCEDTQWPLETGHVDRLILLHGLENSENAPALLDECWRVLGPGGKAMFIVPNRAGIWAQRDKTPFGFGRPYTTGQLEALLKRHNFVPERQLATLFQPPSHARFWQRMGPFFERLGSSTAGKWVGGALMVEVSKRVHAPQRPGLSEAVRRPLEVLEGIKKPDTKPA